MKKIFLALSFILLLGGLPVTASYAGTACAPGCDCPKNPDGTYGGVYGAQQAHGNAAEVKDKAITAQTVKMPDNAAGMTCLDRAMMLTSTLGQMFSDHFPPGMKIPGQAKSLFGNSTYPDAGTASSANSKSQNYSMVLKKIISGSLQNYAANFDPNTVGGMPIDGSLSAALGATNLTYLDTQADGIFSSITNPINATAQTISNTLDDINDTLDTITQKWNQYSGIATSIANFLGLSQLAQYITDIGTYLTEINDLMDDVSDLWTQVGGVISTITGIMNSLGNIDHLNNQSNGDCDRLSRLWGSKDSGVTGFQPLVGGGNDKGTPYFTLKDMLTSAQSGSYPAGVGDTLKKAISNDNGSGGVIQKALDAFTPGQPLGGPSTQPGSTWPAVPTQVFQPNASVDDIINAMNM